MLSVLRVHLPLDLPIVGCELMPYILLWCLDGSITNDDAPESAPIDGFLKYKRYRIQSDKKVIVCSVHPSQQATLQCLGRLKAEIPVAKSNHCSPKCFSDAWQHHRALHDQATIAVNETETDDEQLFGCFGSLGSGILNAGLSSSTPTVGPKPSVNNGSAPSIV